MVILKTRTHRKCLACSAVLIGKPVTHASLTVCLLLSARALFYLFPELSNRYEEAKAKGMDNYDRELEETIERLISECERKIQRALKRLEEDDAKAAIAISVTEVTQVYSFIIVSSPWVPRLWR